MQQLVFLLISLWIMGATTVESAVPRERGSGGTDEGIVADARLVGSGQYIELYGLGVRIDPSFLEVVERAYKQVESIIGHKLDTATLGPKVQVYVSDRVRISHVWKGYDHPADPKGIIFLNLTAYEGAMTGHNATYIHELTHLFTWRYTSHTLREGIADYVALKIHPGAAVGPNPAVSEPPPNIPSEILALLGTTKPPPGWLSTDRVRRRAYYFASRRFVDYLVGLKGMEAFFKLYASEHPETEIKNLYGISRQEAVIAALRANP